jgi:hypothetical protein
VTVFWLSLAILADSSCMPDILSGRLRRIADDGEGRSLSLLMLGGTVCVPVIFSQTRFCLLHFPPSSCIIEVEQTFLLSAGSQSCFALPSLPGGALLASPAYLPSLVVLSSHPCIEAAWFLLVCQPLHACLVRAVAPMWGTKIAHFQPAAPPLSLSARFPNMTCIFSMSINVHLFMVNSHPLPSWKPPKQFQRREM